MSKAASAAVGATLDTTIRPPHTVRIDWTDGKQSLVKLPDKLFTHLALMLQSRQTAPVESMPVEIATSPSVVAPIGLGEQALAQLSGFLKDRIPVPATALELAPAIQPDIAEQITKLAALRDAGILSEDEFSNKKSELLARL